MCGYKFVQGKLCVTINFKVPKTKALDTIDLFLSL